MGKKKNTVDAVTLSLFEIKDLAELAGFKISELPENYESVKNEPEGAFVVYQDNENGFSLMVDGKPSGFRVVCTRWSDEECDNVIPLGEDVLGEE